MRRSQSPFRARSLLIGSVTLALLASLLPLATASATVTLTPATGGTTILADGTYSTLTGPILTESMAGELGTGSIVIGVQQGQADFSFNPGVGDITVGGAGCAGMTLTNVTIAVNGIGVVIATPSTSPCTITWSGIQVKANHAVPLSSENLTAQGSANIPNAGGNWGNLVEVAAAPQLVFTAGPNGVETVNVNMNDPAILDQDAAGNPRSGDAVTLSISSGSGPGTLTCSSPLTQTTGPSGQLTWNGCKIDQSGTYRLHASTATAQADTGSFVVNGAPTHLGVISYPAATTPTALTPGLSFGVYDASNNLVTTDTRNVTLSINLNPGSFSCPGGLTKAAVGGVASFPGCTQTVQASGYAVTASASGVTAITGPLFTVNSVVASKLQLCWGTAAVCNTTPPSPNTPATASATQPTVRVQDAAGNTVTSDNTTVVSLAIASGTPTSGGPGTLSCTGGNSATVVAGIATFAGCAISTAGVGYQLTATSVPALTSSTSSAFTVGGAGAPTKLKFVVQPPATVGVGVAFPSNVQVGITDAGGERRDQRHRGDDQPRHRGEPGRCRADLHRRHIGRHGEWRRNVHRLLAERRWSRLHARGHDHLDHADDDAAPRDQHRVHRHGRRDAGPDHGHGLGADDHLGPDGRHQRALRRRGREPVVPARRRPGSEQPGQLLAHRQPHDERLGRRDLRVHPTHEPLLPGGLRGRSGSRGRHESVDPGRRPPDLDPAADQQRCRQDRSARARRSPSRRRFDRHARS